LRVTKKLRGKAVCKEKCYGKGGREGEGAKKTMILKKGRAHPSYRLWRDKNPNRGGLKRKGLNNYH